jgi:hypothetical protein
MSEAVQVQSLLFAPSLGARVSDLVRRVADVIETSCASGPESHAAVVFLRSLAQSDDDAEPGPGAFQRLAAFGLSPAEEELVLLAGLPDEHEGLAATFRSLHPAGEPRPTVGLAALLAGGGRTARQDVRELLSTGAAVRHHLLHVAGHGTFFERSLTLLDGVWETLHGHDGWPDDLVRVRLAPTPYGLERWSEQPDVRRAVEALGSGRPVVVLVVDEDETVALSRAAAMADAARVPVAAARLAPTDAAGLARLGVHAALRGAVPLVVATGGAPDLPARELALPVVPGAFLVCAAPGTVLAGPDRALLPVPVRTLRVRDHRDAWERAVPSLADRSAALAARHPLDPARTAELAADSAWADRLDLAGVSRLVRARATAALPTGAWLTTPDVPWEQVVLPDESGLQLRDAVTRLDHQHAVLEDWGMRRRAHAVPGARLLLSGPPGTGKSLAAAAVATALETDLLVVDVSRIVSKWLGETEKNLSAVFDAAERTQAVLLLDEADALFATRTEVSDAHDRYANLETAYLLQRLDRFEGLAILTSNLRGNIDVAFMRRMDFVVEFPLPDAALRAELWRLHLPERHVDADVDVESLARLYAVPGAWIRNCVVAAAYGAAAGDGSVHLHHLVAAMRREFAKAGLPFPGEPLRRQP